MKNGIRLLLIMCAFIISCAFQYKNVSDRSFFVVVDKSDYELSVYDNDGWLVTYPVVFGNKDLGDKLVQGDRKTPEGTFTITSKRVHEKWDRFIMLDYPNAESYAKFNDRKSRGVIPQGAAIGGGIGIHGTWKHEGYAVDQYQNWTEGCISMKDEYVEELYNMIPVGTRVLIRR